MSFRILYGLWIACAGLLFSAPSAQGFTLDLNAFYMSDTLTVSSDTTSTKIFGDLAAMMSMDRKGRLLLGWSYGYISINESGSTTSEFSLTEMGPKIGYYITKDYLWSVFFVYNLQSTAEYSSGATTAEWRGTSMKAEIGFTPAFSETFYAGLKLNYYLASFDEQFVSGTTFSTISNTRTTIYPTVAFIYRFN